MDHQKLLESIGGNIISNIASNPLSRGAEVVFNMARNATERKHFEEQASKILDSCAANLGDPVRFRECVENYEVLETCANYVLKPSPDHLDEAAFVRQTADTLFRHMRDERNSGTSASDKGIIQVFIQQYLDLWKEKLMGRDTYAAYQAVQNGIVLNRIEAGIINHRNANLRDVVQEDHFPYIEIALAEPYIPRYIQAITQEAETDGKNSLLGCLEKEKHIIMLSDAGNGKSTELDNLYIQAKEQGFHPLYVQLKNYPYDISFNHFMAGEYIKQPLLIMDGLDEMEAEYRQEFIQKINGSKEYLRETPIVISSRRNFYPLTKENTGAFDDFKPYELMPLDKHAINDYFVHKGIEYQAFMDEAHKQNLDQLVIVPFYLIHLVGLYEKERQLPNRKDVMSAICIRMIEHDTQRGAQLAAPIPNTARILLLLRRTAFIMQLMHAVELDDETVNNLYDYEIQQVLLTSGLMKRDQGKWSFTHNNFREFLTADFMREMPLSAALDFIVSPCDKTSIQSFWINVFSYYVMINEGNDALEKWVYENCPQQIILFDRDRTIPNVRRNLLLNVIKYANDNYLWITTLDPDIEDIVNYCQSQSALKDMLDVLEAGTYDRALYNVLHVIECFSYIGPDCENRLESLLLSILRNDTIDNYQKSKAIRVITKHRFCNQIEAILKMFRDCIDTDINKNLLKMLVDWDLCAERIDEVIRIIERNQENRFVSDAGYSWVIEDALGAAKTPEAIKTLVLHIISEDGGSILLRRKALDKLIANAVCLYKNEHLEVTESMHALLVWASNNLGESEVVGVMHFCLGINRADLFLHQILELNEHDADMVAYYTINEPRVTKEAIDEINEQRDGYEKLLNFLFNYATRQNPYIDEINRLCLRYRGCSFVTEDPTNVIKRRTEALIRYLDALCEKDRYEHMIDRLKQAFGEERLGVGELRTERALRYKLDADLQRAARVFLRMDEVPEETDILDAFQKIDFDCFRAVEVRRMLLEEKNTIELPDELRTIICTWCECILERFSQSQDYETITYNEVYAADLTMILDIEMEPRLYLEMLHIPSIYTSFSVEAYLQYVENKVPAEQLRVQIQSNLNSGQMSEEVENLHIQYCKKHRLPYALRCAKQICEKASEDHTVYAYDAFNYIVDLTSFDEAVESFLPFKNKALLGIMAASDKLRYSSQMEKALIEAYEEDHRSDWLLGLIRIQSKAGVEYYLAEARDKMTLPDFGGDGSIHHITEAISILKDPSLLDEIWQMLCLACDPCFRDAEFLGLGHNAWKALQKIAVQDFDAVMSRIDAAFSNEATNEKMKKYLGSLKQNIINDRLLRTEIKLGWREAKAAADKIQQDG